MKKKIQVELYIQKIVSPSAITDEELSSLPAYRQKRIASARHDLTKAQLFTAGLLMRDILGVTKDEDLELSESGKPYLKSKACCFSVSHDDHVAILAAAPAEIGVDAEDCKEFSDVLQKRVFTEEERFFIAQDPCRNGARLWTRLEAALKLSGEGIAGMDHRTFSLTEDGRYCFKTLEYNESVLSIACREPFELQVKER